MNSKARVLNTFNYEKADRVPLNFDANPTILSKIMAHYKVASRENLLKELNIDIRGIYNKYIGKPLHGVHSNPLISIDPERGIRTKWIENSSGGYQDFCEFHLENASYEEILNYPLPDPDDYDYDFVLEQAKAFKDYAVFAGNPGVGDIINSNGMLRGMEQVLIDMATDDEAGMLLTKRRTEVDFKILERTLAKLKGHVDFIWLGEDLGTQSSPLISLDTYRKHIKPYHKMFIDLAKSYNLPVMIHTCGSSSWVYEDFIEMGVNAVDTLQPEAVNMSPEYLVEHFGKRLAFHGCISTAGPLAYGTAEEVRDYVKNTLDIMRPNGGYILAPTHLIQDNTPVENVVAMYEAAKDFQV